jgi:hypothetical protein
MPAHAAPIALAQSTDIVIFPDDSVINGMIR